MIPPCVEHFSSDSALFAISPATNRVHNEQVSDAMADNDTAALGLGRAGAFKNLRERRKRSGDLAKLRSVAAVFTNSARASGKYSIFRADRSCWPHGDTHVAEASHRMNISDAQRENRHRFHGGFFGQLVSGMLWLVSAGLAVTVGVKSAIIVLVIGGFLIFPATESLVRLSGREKLSEANTLWQLGMQVAFVLPISMLLLVPVTQYHTNLFYPGLMILLGAHYIPFVFLYGMRLFAFLAAILIGGGVCLAMFHANTFSTGAWITGVVLVLFAFLGRQQVRNERPPET